MEDRFIVEDVRKRLVLAGLNELCEHGITDFSLRRVSVAAQVSCAAPYRHFKDKDELIGAIIEYIGSKWLLLSKEIRAAFLLDRKRLALELSVSAIRFWVANGNFRTVLMTDGANAARFSTYMNDFDKDLRLAISDLYADCDVSEEDVDRVKTAVRSMIYGTVMLIGTGRLENTPKTIMNVKKSIERELDGILK